MSSGDISALLRELGGPCAQDAWALFLDCYSPVMRQVILLSFADPDDQADCFVFACEALAEKGFRRLRKFDPAGSASFSTWLRAVVRNLSRDWYRKQHGRYQSFAWARELSLLDQHVFHEILEERRSPEETLARLGPLLPGVTAETIEEAAARLAATLTERERWLLATRHGSVESLDAGEESDVPEVADPLLDPEHVLIKREYQEALQRALQELPAPDQLILRLRFEQDVTLQEIARCAQLKDAQTADRRIRALLDRLRSRMKGFAATAEKAEAHPCKSAKANWSA
jgi:RNA polymerase sigma factor (sigma-70 family)